MVLIQKLNFSDFQSYREEFIKCLSTNDKNVNIKKILIFTELHIDSLPKLSKVQYIVKRGFSSHQIIDYSKKISKEDKFIYSTPFHIFGFELKQNEHNKNLIQTDKYTIFYRDSKIDTINFNTKPDNSLFKVTLPHLEEEPVIPVIRKRGELVSTESKKIDNNRLDVVIVSVNYNDFLLASLSRNYKQFGNITIVTSSEDLMCQKICDKFGVNCVVTDIMYEDGAKFNKGKAINAGINSLVEPSWILLLDADIIVEGIIDTNLLDGNTLYTADRYLCEEYNKLKLYQNGEIEISSIGQFEPNRGLGFFQLFHSSKENKYPETSDDAAWSDLMFRDKFTSRKKIENSVIHLGRAYANWEGRATDRFLTDEVFNQIFTRQSTYTICSYYFNFRNDIRQKQNFVKFLEQFNGHYDKMIVGIVDYGDIDFEIPCKSIVIKGDSEKRIWSKEILINKIIDEIDTDYLLWIDGDLIYEDLSWLNNIDSVVKDNDFVQLFETIDYLAENGEVLETHKSIMSSGRTDIDNLLGEGYKPGGAWLGRTSILKEKKLFEQMYVGGGDTIFIYGLFGITDGWTLQKVKQGSYRIYRESKKWISIFGKKKVSFLNTNIKHYFHGDLSNRNYNNRYLALSKKARQNEIVVYTCITGMYDTLKDIQNKEENIDYICFTDNLELESETWDIKKIPDFLYEFEQTKQARCIKILPHLFLSDYKTSVWVDGNIEIIGNIEEFIHENLKNDFAIPKHPDRICIYDEAETILRLGKDTFENVNPQIQKYKEMSYPSKNGLVQSQIIIRNHNNKNCISIAEDWWNELKKGSKRDQLSFNYSIWKKEVEIDIINPSMTCSKYFQFYKHSGEKVKLRFDYDSIKNYINGKEV